MSSLWQNKGKTNKKARACCSDCSAPLLDRCQRLSLLVRGPGQNVGNDVHDLVMTSAAAGGALGLFLDVVKYTDRIFQFAVVLKYITFLHLHTL